jgi:hypothetical protein
MSSGGFKTNHFKISNNVQKTGKNIKRALTRHYL